ncbi:MAG: coproporphyrinogen III oxidase [Thermodesulfovibrio sp.]|nr:coproporphyrinogen III oxidase [Thermodesulfovibrio sp.]
MTDALYIHLPFCARKCLYCDFLSVPFSAARAEQYVVAVCTELSMKKKLFESLSTLYIGGGTPTLLGLERLVRLFRCLRDTCGLSPDTEITLEANPGTVSSDLLDALRSLGVNRLSIGVQSFQDSELKVLGRIHNSAEAACAIAEASASGFSNISLDLMYGIPGQTMASWKDTLSQAVSLGPTHISAYELTPEKETPLFGMLSSGKLSLPHEDLVLDMYGFAIDFLGEHGYRHYEISNFARPGRECRHNLNYWDRGDYAGVGAGAHSFVNGIRAYNSSDLEHYIEELHFRCLPQKEEQALTRAEASREHIFLGLRKTEGILMTSPVFSVFHLHEAASGLLEKGYLKTCGEYLSLTRRGLVVSNMVIGKLLDNLGL